MRRGLPSPKVNPKEEVSLCAEAPSLLRGMPPYAQRLLLS